MTDHAAASETRGTTDFLTRSRMCSIRYPVALTEEQSPYQRCDWRIGEWVPPVLSVHREHKGDKCRTKVHALHLEAVMERF